MEKFGPNALFSFIAAVYVVFIVIILYRMGARSSVPAERRGRFIALLRTSTIFARLARQTGNGEKDAAGRGAYGRATTPMRRGPAA